MNIFLIRHGQASFGEENYDRLSEKGRLQAELLSEYLRKNFPEPDLVCMGSLKRHEETAAPFIRDRKNCSTVKDRALDEFTEKLWRDMAVHLRSAHPEFGKLISVFQKFSGQKTERVKKMFFRLTGIILHSWRSGITPNGNESWAEFKKKKTDFLKDISKKNHENIYIFSSGIPLTVMLSDIFGFGSEREMEISLYLWNTSLSILHSANGKIIPVTVNSIPHLQNSENWSRV
ncbi:MAG TPA: histidine phosphatase family protein [Leptospiraceae bacterium]|nr:histidine phosphatase family protein [Leptospiraceae bacterium]HNM03565.1 histidine phosphatase family protein [Leptospiraceae bacterium]